MKKILIERILDQLPEEFEIEDFIGKLQFIDKVEIGLKQAQEGKTVTLQKARKKFFDDPKS